MGATMMPVDAQRIARRARRAPQPQSVRQPRQMATPRAAPVITLTVRAGARGT